MRFDPFRELDRVTERSISQAARTMSMEALRRGDECAVYLDLPGVDPDDVDVTVENNVVTIRALASSEPDRDSTERHEAKAGAASSSQ